MNKKTTPSWQVAVILFIGVLAISSTAIFIRLAMEAAGMRGVGFSLFSRCNSSYYSSSVTTSGMEKQSELDRFLLGHIIMQPLLEVVWHYIFPLGLLPYPLHLLLLLPL